MMGRLFWKIFLWFWLALALLNFAVGWGVKIYVEQTDAVNKEAMQTQVSAIALAIERGDRREAAQLVRRVSQDIHRPIFVVTPKGRDVLGRPLPHHLKQDIQAGDYDDHVLFHATANLASGERLHVIAPKRPPFQARFGKAPLWLALLITLLVSTLVCYVLARYLAKPVRQLSAATNQLAGGNLDVRIGPLRRKDDIADLARDFDQMAAKLQALVNSQTKLLQDVSHELRSPLARLQVALALAQREGIDNQYIEHLHRDLDRLDFLIGEILTLSRMDTVSYPKERFNLAELANIIIDDCQLEAEHKSCVIEDSLDREIEILGSPELLRRAIENILRNAVKFADSHTAINVSITDHNSNAVIEITDQGPGISPEDHAHLFEPFYRGDQARDHSVSGYGLGLSIAKKAIELHKGTINFEEAAKGGSRVVIILPTAA
jgi:two-component system, OmpR family, sensor kinase